MIQKVNSLSSNVYTSHGEILKVFFFFKKYVDLPIISHNCTAAKLSSFGVEMQTGILAPLEYFEQV